MICYSHPAYYVPLPEGHPFPIEKYPETLRVLLESSDADKLDVRMPLPVSWEEITLVHEESYLRAVESDGLSSYARNRLGLPHHPRFLERSLLDVGGTLAAARTALEVGVAWNLGGGTHHAMPAEGLGFCVTNDVSTAVKVLLREEPDLQILIIDTDAHQGNGNHFVLGDLPNVFTYSIHVGANYPAQKVPGDMDVSVDRYVEGADYLKSLSRSLSKLGSAFSPDLIFWISGVDVHVKDRFGQMRLSTEDMCSRDAVVLEFLQSTGASWVGTMGGGYHLDTSQTPQLHAMSVENSIAWTE